MLLAMFEKQVLIFTSCTVEFFKRKKKEEKDSEN